MTKEYDKSLAARKAKIDVDYDVDEDYWTRAKISAHEKIEESQPDNFQAWHRPLYGAAYFAIGFFMMLTMSEIYPFMINEIGYCILGIVGGLGMGWGLYTMAS